MRFSSRRSLPAWPLALLLLPLIGCLSGLELASDLDELEADGQALSVSFNAVEDAWIRAASTSANFGTHAQLDLDKADTSGGERRAFVKFQVTGMQGKVISRARIQLKCERSSNLGGNVHGISNAWKEREINWKNQPGLGAKLSSKGAVTKGSSVEFDVTPAVNGDGTYSFALVTTSDQKVLYSSREGAFAPRLVLTYETSAAAPVDAGTLTEPVDAGTPTSPVDAGTPTGTLGNVIADGIWIGRSEIMALPMSGPAWTALKAQADKPAGTPNISNQDDKSNVYVMAKALVYARTGQEKYRTEVRQAVMAAMGTEAGGRTLALGRNLGAFVISADLVGLDPSSEAPAFRQWLMTVFTRVLDSKTLISTHEDRPNNWGTHAGASRAAAAAYLSLSPVASQRDFGKQQLARTAQVFKGYLGDRAAYAGFKYGELSWQADSSKPVGVNPKGATKSGQSIDGAQPEEMRRGCTFTTPPCQTGYAWEGLQGSTAQAEILYRAGYDSWNWSDKALLRAAQYLKGLHDQYGGWWASGDDQWQPWILNFSYGTQLPSVSGTTPGKNVGWTDWTHDRATRSRQ